jgi:hypothetical protein
MGGKPFGCRFEAGPARNVSPKIGFAPFGVPPAFFEAVDLVEELVHEMRHFPVLPAIFRPSVSDEQRAIGDGLHRRPCRYQVRINIVGQFAGQIFGEDRREVVPRQAGVNSRTCAPLGARMPFLAVQPQQEPRPMEKSRLQIKYPIPNTPCPQVLQFNLLFLGVFVAYGVTSDRILPHATFRAEIPIRAGGSSPDSKASSSATCNSSVSGLCAVHRAPAPSRTQAIAAILVSRNECKCY